MDPVFARLQQWFADQCDGDWEHGFGIQIATLDNPGWRVTIDLAGTALDGRSLATLQLEPSDVSMAWHRIWVSNNQFEGAGDPSKLGLILGTFLDWAEQPRD